MLKARQTEIVDENGKQLAVVVASNVPKSTARRWAQFIVDRENSQRRGEEGTKARKASNTSSQE